MMKYPFECISDLVFVDRHIEPADVILVPGSSKPQAIIRAAELYCKGMAPYILPSGGPNNRLEQYPSEWEFLRKEAMNCCLPEEAILREDMAKNTFENARFSLKVLEDNISKRRGFFYISCSGLQRYSKDNWYTNEDWIRIVIGEVVKIGKYFEKEIINMTEKFK